MAENKVCEVLLKKGYPTHFCELIGNECRTPFMEKKMLGYLYQCKKPSMESIVDEMLALQSVRETFVKKKIMENSQSYMNNKFRNR